MPKDHCLGVLLAAGASRRFGPEDKLLAQFRGRPLVTHAAEALEGAGCDTVAAVVSSAEVASHLPKTFITAFVSPESPMAVSFHRAIDLAKEQGAARLLICLGDMPNVPATLLQTLLCGSRSNACVIAGTRMPPMMLTCGDYAKARDSADGDRGARTFLATLQEDTLLRLSIDQARDIDRLGDIEK